MKRYAVCKIIGDGLTPETAFRAAIEDVVDPATGFKAFNTAVVMPPSDPVTGAPTKDWCLAIAAGDNFKLLADNADIDLMPDVPLDVKVSAVETPAKNTMGAKLQARGINTSFVSNADGYREVIRNVGKELAAEFDENKFDVSE